LDLHLRLFAGLRHPADLGGTAVQAFLSWLASERQVAASTHRLALSASLFLCGRGRGRQFADTLKPALSGRQSSKWRESAYGRTRQRFCTKRRPLMLRVL